MIKKKLLALVAMVMSVCALGNTGVFAVMVELPLVTESWVSGDADSDELIPYIDPFKEYVGKDFDENSFFILQVGSSKENMDQLDRNLNNALYIEIATNSTQELNIAMAQYIDKEVLSSIGITAAPETGYYGYDNSNSNSINASNTFTVSNGTPYTIQRTWIRDAVWNALRYGFQVLNEEDLTVGTTITLRFYGVIYNGVNPTDQRVELDTITYTFTGTEWVTATDAGYYLVGDTPNGVVRFLFKSNIEGEITQSGIKYIKGSNITDYVDGETAAIEGGTGTASAFYGDIADIPNGDMGTYYAVAYVTTVDGQTHWSDVVSCTPDFTNQIDYGGASK